MGTCRDRGRHIGVAAEAAFDGCVFEVVQEFRYAVYIRYLLRL